MHAGVENNCLSQRDAHQHGRILSHLRPSYCLAIFDFAFRSSEMGHWTKKTSRLEFNSWRTKLLPSTLSALYDYTALVAAGIYTIRSAPPCPFQLTAIFLPLLRFLPLERAQWLH